MGRYLWCHHQSKPSGQIRCEAAVLVGHHTPRWDQDGLLYCTMVCPIAWFVLRHPTPLSLSISHTPPRRVHLPLLGKDFRELADEIFSIMPAGSEISLEVPSTSAEDMIREGRRLVEWQPNAIVKVPMTLEGLKAISALSALGIRTNCTLIFSANQALLAARAGAYLVSPFVGRLDDLGHDGMQVRGGGGSSGSKAESAPTSCCCWWLH